MYKHGCPRRFLSQNHHSSRLTETNMDTKNLRRSVVTHGSSAFLSSDSSDSFSSCSQERIIPKGLGTRHRRSQITCVYVCVCVCVCVCGSTIRGTWTNRRIVLVIDARNSNSFELLWNTELTTIEGGAREIERRGYSICGKRVARDYWIFGSLCQAVGRSKF